MIHIHFLMKLRSHRCHLELMNKHVEKMSELQEKNIELEKNIKHYKSIAVLCPITQEPIINEVVNVVDGQKYEKEGESFPFSYVLDPFFGDATVTRCRHLYLRPNPTHIRNSRLPSHNLTAAILHWLTTGSETSPITRDLTTLTDIHSLRSLCAELHRLNLNQGENTWLKDLLEEEKQGRRR